MHLHLICLSKIVQLVPIPNGHRLVYIVSRQSNIKWLSEKIFTEPGSDTVVNVHEHFKNACQMKRYKLLALDQVFKYKSRDQLLLKSLPFVYCIVENVNPLIWHALSRAMSLF